METIVTVPPKSKQAADIIRAEINALGLKPGTRLLTAREFATRLSVSKHVVQNAFAVLEKEGLLETHVGRGTFVVARPVKNSVAMVCDLVYFSNGDHRFVDKVVELLESSAGKYDFAPHFLTGRGADAKTFAASLSIESSVWDEIKGVVAMAWKDGLAELLAERGIPLVTISSTHLVPNSVIFDYETMGRQAARLFASDDPEEIFLISNQDFEERQMNNPIHSFMSEWKRRGGDPVRVRILAADTRFEAGYEMGRRIGNTARRIFFTDDNVGRGFAAWQNEESRERRIAVQVVSQASYEMAAELPAEYDKLAFVIETVCDEAVAMLRRLSSGEQDGPEQRFIAPILLPGKRDVSLHNVNMEMTE